MDAAWHHNCSAAYGVWRHHCQVQEGRTPQGDSHMQWRGAVLPQQAQRLHDLKAPLAVFMPAGVEHNRCAPAATWIEKQQGVASLGMACTF